MSFYSLGSKTLAGSSFSFEQLKGKVVVLVNVASKCGYTKQYAGLEALHKDYKDKGVQVLGIPCNQFGSQEPGTPEEILSFCSKNYNVTFPILEKTMVNGPETNPIYAFLKSKLPGDIAWNFEKFLVDKQGNVIARFKSKTTPDELRAEIDKLL